MNFHTQPTLSQSVSVYLNKSYYNHSVYVCVCVCVRLHILLMYDDSTTVLNA